MTLVPAYITATLTLLGIAAQGVLTWWRTDQHAKDLVEHRNFLTAHADRLATLEQAGVDRDRRLNRLEDRP